ncbi:FosB proto-oncogene, AP-1 transcription factor subunit [Bothrops jararaca]|uniref:FosB proto-oncogene, AP-1 transcription factor subunit n=1 Tax=Bothrops jararaca TaxID=8724 RepID=A0A8T1N5U5_BOTJA|nr:FosB proto-oncogene, AP-1 transcription factor subunit [Bothrops jararaca]
MIRGFPGDYDSTSRCSCPPRPSPITSPRWTPSEPDGPRRRLLAGVQRPWEMPGSLCQQ